MSGGAGDAGGLSHTALLAAALPNYEIGGEIGRGGFGVVFGGRHRQLGREVAIKQLPPALAGNPHVRARFVAEAQVLASLDHPHIVPVYDYVERDGLCLLVMEKLPGGTVWSRFQTTGFTMDESCAVLLATSTALHCAHGNGVLHRDVKPENVMFASNSVLKVTDFGIAKVIGGRRTLATREGEILGTPAYMAPEQAEAGELSPATDVYAAGVMLYELLSGRLPFPDDGNALGMLYRHVHEQPTPLLEVAPEVPPPLAEVTMRALATDPADRYASAEAFGVALAEAMTAASGPGWLNHRELPVMAGGPIVAATERPSAAGAEPPTREQARARRRSRPSAAPAAARVRPTVHHHTRGRLPADLRASELVPVDQVLRRRPVGPALAVLSLVFLLLAVGVALRGLGSPRSSDLVPGVLQINGVDPAVVSPVAVDLARPLLVSGRLPQAAPAGRVRLTFSVAGLPLASATAPAEVGPDGSFRATLDAGASRYLAAGLVTGRVELLDGAGTADGGAAAPVQAALRLEHLPVLSVPGGAAVALLLFVLAYAESLLRSLRRGRKRVSGTIGLLVLGGLTGVAAVAAAWLARVREPTVPTLVACALLGAAAGLAAALTALRFARWRRPAPR